MAGYKDYRLSPDTTPEAEALLFDMLAKKSPAEKLHMVSEASEMVRMLALNGLRQRFPNASEIELKIRLAELLYGADVAGKIADKLTGV